MDEVKHWMIVRDIDTPKHLAKARVCQNCFEAMCKKADASVESVTEELYRDAVEWWPTQKQP